jgi:hypothetical protein
VHISNIALFGKAKEQKVFVVIFTNGTAQASEKRGSHEFKYPHKLSLPDSVQFNVSILDFSRKDDHHIVVHLFHDRVHKRRWKASVLHPLQEGIVGIESHIEQSTLLSVAEYSAEEIETLTVTIIGRVEGEAFMSGLKMADNLMPGKARFHIFT